MNTKAQETSPEQSAKDAIGQEKAMAKLSEHIAPLPNSQPVLASLALRLENRIQTSASQHTGLQTVRGRDGFWKTLVAGIRYKPLWQGPQGNSVLIEFAAGAALPLHRHQFLEEGIVLSGSLQLDDEVLAEFDYHVSPAGSRHGKISSKAGAVAFLRGSSVGQPVSMFKEVLGGLLLKNHKVSQSVLEQESTWVEIQDGLFQKDLWSDGSVTSRFYCMKPGCKVAGHHHPIAEETMMLSGEVFLGDILLQQGDYHLAPAGSQHFELSSDSGGMFFVRGTPYKLA